MPESKPTGQQRCDLLSSAYGRRPLDMRPILLEAGASGSYRKYCSFLKSLDGAIRHAQRIRDQEERQKCDDCGAEAPSMVGCPDGAEICQPCFNEGRH